ncbi:DUF1657 domain-containing protein [Ornithinibacillus gellani]|uniref:DUF1657 domain-containing protein n=1 Tax=Ornithinibacillus gellani TaxID=2293253 RepID=UPI000F46C3B8|nr:DUF1657 domain-containing protein [Ornithinibacillus gellani]TQS74348.1 DUF1657 domain-containing protein [Ornithinibacillus gellani]
MTVATQMQQAIASCQSVLANLNTFALETEDQNVKKMYQTLAQQQQVILDNLDARFSYIKAEEPQFNE